jgi:glycosyltransferase involved in cell wall biosynthesis
MYNGKKLSVILPSYNEVGSIRKVVNDFFDLMDVNGNPLVDEVVVVNNNAITGTSEEVQKTKAIEVFEPKQGYGSAIQRGFKEAKGDLLVVCEPDDTFIASDIYKLLVFSFDVDIVYGSRTIKYFIWKGANMGFFLRWGNWAVAKLIEVLFGTNYLSDVGCTYRLIKREALEKIEDQFEVESNFFSPEMIIIGYQMKIPCIQIPVNYKTRIGESSVTGKLWKAVKLGVKMIILVFAMRFNVKKKILKFIQ